jgi:thioesterase domain-containing protein
MVPLQEKGDGVPLSCISGIEMYRPLARALGKERPVYAVYVEDERVFLEQAAAGRIAAISIGELAHGYAQAILRAQSKGPLSARRGLFWRAPHTGNSANLGSFGSRGCDRCHIDTVRANGKKIEWAAFAAGKARELLTVGPSKIVDRLVQRLRIRTLLTLLRGLKPESQLDVLREFAFIKAMEASNGACDVHCPVLLIKAADHATWWGEGYLFADDYGWDAALGKPVRAIEVPGNHLRILKPPFVEELGRQLRAELKANYPIEAVG